VEPEECPAHGDVVRVVDGPFLVDPNIRVLLLQLDDQACVLRLGALHDPAAQDQMGALLFIDVRALSLRSADTPFDFWVSNTIEDGWALQLDGTDYLARARREDAQRSAESLQGHFHFVVPDGNHHAVDVVARSCAVAAVPAAPGADLAALVASITPFDW
jgi:hypothetical protein